MNQLKAQLAAMEAARIAEALQGEDDETIREAVKAGSCFEELLSIALTELREREMLVEAIGLRQADLAERKARENAQAEKRRKFIGELMALANLRKVVLPEGTLGKTSVAPKPIVTDVDALPDSCVRIERKPDMAAIREAAKHGDVPGVVWSNGSETLTIRSK